MLCSCAKRCQTESLHRFTNTCQDPELCQNILSPRTNLAQAGWDRPPFFFLLIYLYSVQSSLQSLTLNLTFQCKEQAPSQSIVYMTIWVILFYHLKIVFNCILSHKKTLQDPNQMIICANKTWLMAFLCYSPLNDATKHLCRGVTIPSLSSAMDATVCLKPRPKGSAGLCAGKKTAASCQQKFSSPNCSLGDS